MSAVSVKKEFTKISQESADTVSKPQSEIQNQSNKIVN